jgi:outer membrane immunogenic protein
LGAQAGCDYQFAGSWVIGIEGSLAGAGISGRGADPRNPEADDRFLSVKTDELASITGRLGFAGWTSVLIYVMGGGAGVHDVFDFQRADRSETRCICGQDRLGWVVGGGIEWIFARNWSAFLELNHYDFGTKLVKTRGTDFIYVGQRIEALKLGVNYRFNWGKAPVVARY